MREKTVIIPDTNVLLHSLPVDQIPWPKLLRVDEVIIVLVPQVLRELDSKKNLGSDKLKKRAQRVLAQISGWYPPGTTSQDVRLADGVSLKLRAKEPAPVADLDYSVFDDRIVGSAIEVRGEVTEHVVVISGDFTMRVKMEARGFVVQTVPDSYRIREEQEPKRELAKEPRIVAGLFADDSSEPHPHVAQRLGLSAAYLLEGAEQELLAISTRNSHFDLMRTLPGPFGQRQPTADDFREYINEIRQYDIRNAKAIKFIIGVANSGGAPADDVTAEFWFPAGLRVTDQKPDWPRRPTVRELHVSQALYLPPHPLEQNESFTIDWADDGSQYARIRVRRLMQSTRVTRQLWATIDDDQSRGFPIEGRVLVALPALTIDTKLNVRILP